VTDVHSDVDVTRDYAWEMYSCHLIDNSGKPLK